MEQQHGETLTTRFSGRSVWTCEEGKMQGGGEGDLKRGRWADKHNQEEGMSVEVSVEAPSVCWVCRGWGRVGSEHMVPALRMRPSVRQVEDACVFVCVWAYRAGGWVTVSFSCLELQLRPKSLREWSVHMGGGLESNLHSLVWGHCKLVPYHDSFLMKYMPAFAGSRCPESSCRTTQWSDHADAVRSCTCNYTQHWCHRVQVRLLFSHYA